MKIQYRLLLIALFGINFSFAQITFETDFEYPIDELFVRSHLASIQREGLSSTESLSELVKYDTELIVYNDNPIANFIFELTKDTNQIFISVKTGKHLSYKELSDIKYWNEDIDIHSNTPVYWYNIMEIKSIKLKQKWRVDTLNATIQNKVLGITPIRYTEDNEKIELFYLPLENDFEDNVINNQHISYVREKYDRLSWQAFDKTSILKVLTHKSNNCVKLSHSNNPLSIQNKKIDNQSKYFKDQYLVDNNTEASIKNGSAGIAINQYLFIDSNKKTINTKLNGISPFYGVRDKNGNLIYYKSTFWVKFDH